MPLFECSKCGCIDNTALSGYWVEQRDSKLQSCAFEPKCTECRTGTWHRQFDKEPATGWLLGSDGFLYSKAEAGERKSWFKQQGITILKEIGIG